MKTSRWVAFGAVLAIATAISAPRARAADLDPVIAEALVAEKGVCSKAYDGAQRARTAGRFKVARADLLTCGRGLCPGALRRDCAHWLDELNAAQPTVVLVASEGGAEVTDVRVVLDGETVADRLTGAAMPVDLGDHVFRFEHSGAAAVEQHVVVREGEKGRRLEVTFVPEVHAPPPPPPAPPVVTSRPVPTSTYATLAVGGAGLAVFGAFGGYGLSQKSALGTCKPTCPVSQVDAARSSFAASDIGLTAGVVGLAFAAVTYFTRPEVVAKSAPQVGGGAVPGGAVVGLSGEF